MIGNFPPRQCGIATYTRDMLDGLTAASPLTQWDVVAINDTGAAYDYPTRVTRVIDQNDAASYLAAADALNVSGAEAAFIQHEFGIFGGPAGDYVLLLMRRLRIPIVVTLHTVLECPDPDQRRVMDEILALAATVVVMARKGADILARVHNVEPSRVRIVPHGAPDRPFSPTAPFKDRFRLSDRKTIMTFGLISPNKGIEVVLKALPSIIERHPDVTYMIVGASHPRLVASEGETYRESLNALAQTLGVRNNILFINRYVADDELIDLLRATDIYATPYLTETQITSGTLTYAIALGKPVVSTPYWHAVEALADGIGVLCPFGDVDAFARELGALLDDEQRRETLARNAWHAGRATRWTVVSAAYLDLVVAARSVAPHWESSLRSLANPGQTALERLFDDVGVIQHGKFRIPDREHGYCLDDAARALSLFALRSRESKLSRLEMRLATTAAAFVNHAWNPEAGRFRNFMAWDRRWLDDGGCDDCNGRAMEALCLTAAYGRATGLSDWAIDLARRVFQQSGQWRSLRARASLVKACLAGESVVVSSREVEETLSRLTAGMAAELVDHGPWFEPRLAYDNARLPEALILGGSRLGQQMKIDSGIEALKWLMSRQRSPDGRFRPVPTSGFAASDASHDAFDQQPIEIPASIDACEAAFGATGDDQWYERAVQAFLWLAGENDLELPLITAEDGGCFDGLTLSGCNQNQGAESILAYHLASVSLRRFMRVYAA